MKLVYSDYFPPFVLECDRVNVLSIEDGSAYYKLVSEFSSQCEGHDGGFVLSDNNSVLNMAKVTELMSSFIPFEVNTKRLITKLYSKLEMVCSNELYEATIRLRAAVSDYFSEACSLLNSDTEFNDQTDIKNLFKCFELKFSESGERISDKVIDYMLNASELDGRKLFVTVGLLEYMGRSETELFFRTVTDHKLTLFMFENRTPDPMELLNRMTIDEDFCVF